MHELIAVFRHGDEGWTTRTIACFEDGERAYSAPTEGRPGVAEAGTIGQVVGLICRGREGWYRGDVQRSRHKGEQLAEKGTLSGRGITASQ